MFWIGVFRFEIQCFVVLVKRKLHDFALKLDAHLKLVLQS